jgi:hypothetical protein
MAENGVIGLTVNSGSPSAPAVGYAKLYADGNTTLKIMDSSGSNLVIPKIVPNKPTSMSAVGTAGQIAFSGSYMYVCITSGSWKACALATF